VNNLRSQKSKMETEL